MESLEDFWVIYLKWNLSLDPKPHPEPPNLSLTWAKTS